WVRGEEAQRTIAWRSSVLGQDRALDPWKPINKGDFFETAFRLAELKPVPVPVTAEPNKTFVRFLLRDATNPGVTLYSGARNAVLGRDGKKTELRQPGVAWVKNSAVTLWGPDRAAVGKATTIFVHDVSAKGKGALLHQLRGT